MFGGFDLSSIVDAGNKLKEGVGSNIPKWDNAESEGSGDDGTSDEDTPLPQDGPAETSAWDSLGLSSALQRVQDTNSSLEQLWGQQVSQLPDFSSYLASDKRKQASDGSDDNDSPQHSEGSPRGAIALPAIGKAPNSLDLDALRTGQRTVHPQTPNQPLRPLSGLPNQRIPSTDNLNGEADGASTSNYSPAMDDDDKQIASMVQPMVNKSAFRDVDLGQSYDTTDSIESPARVESSLHQQLPPPILFPKLDGMHSMDAPSDSLYDATSPRQAALSKSKSVIPSLGSTADLGKSSAAIGSATGDSSMPSTASMQFRPQATQEAASPAQQPGRQPGEQPGQQFVQPANDMSADGTESATAYPEDDIPAGTTAVAFCMPSSMTTTPATYEAACDALRDVREVLAAREVQLERKSREVADIEALCRKLQDQNASLESRCNAAGGEGHDSVREEAAQRVATAERMVQALSKERDALKRGSQKLTSATDLLKTKDDIITQVMAEGEALSKKQLTQEVTIKKLRASSKEAAEKLAALQAEINSKSVSLSDAIASAAAAQKAKQELDVRHLQGRQQERQHFQGLLTKARSAQVQAEQAAAAGEREESIRLLREAEARAEAAEEAAAELRATLEQQQGIFSHREDRAAREAAEWQRRVAEADARHEELSARLPEATRPLVRQLESVRAASEAQASSWAATERSLSRRRADAEARATASSEAARTATDRLQASQGRFAALAGSLEAAKAEAAECQTVADECRQRAAEAESRAARLQERQVAATAAAALEQTQLAEAQQRIRGLSGAKDELTAQVERLTDSLAAADGELQRLRQQLQAQHGQQQPSKGMGSPPAMAGVGYKWKLVKADSQDAPSPQSPAQLVTYATSASGTEQYSTASLVGNAYSITDSAKESALRDGLRHRDDQLASLRTEIGRLEATRDSLAEELVAAAQAQEVASASRDIAEAAQRQTILMASRMAAAEELLGEREESLFELRADLADVKQAYREQIEFCVAALASAQRSKDGRLSVAEVPSPAGDPDTASDND